MKKLVFIALVALMTIPFQSEAGEWSSWKTMSCFTGLQVQVKKLDYPGKWLVKIRNNYREKASMSIRVFGNVGSKDDDGRFTVASGDDYTQYYFIDADATRINYEINKVKFNDTGFGGPYADCQ